jgi:hypothetical protein
VLLRFTKSAEVKYASALRRREAVPEDRISIPSRIIWSNIDSTSIFDCSIGDVDERGGSMSVPELALDSSDQDTKGSDQSAEQSS